MTVRYLFLSNETVQRSYEYPTVDVRSPYGVNALTVLLWENIYSGPWMSIPYIFDEMALVPPQRLRRTGNFEVTTETDMGKCCSWCSTVRRTTGMSRENWRRTVWVKPWLCNE